MVREVCRLPGARAVACVTSAPGRNATGNPGRPAIRADRVSDYFTPVATTRLQPCRRCGKEMNPDSGPCPWCGYARRLPNLVPFLLLVLVGIVLALAAGALRWESIAGFFGSLRGRVP